jgi:hypothetical protein
MCKPVNLLEYILDFLPVIIGHEARRWLGGGGIDPSGWFLGLELFLSVLGWIEMQVGVWDSQENEMIYDWTTLFSQF